MNAIIKLDFTVFLPQFHGRFNTFFTGDLNQIMNLNDA